MFRGPNVAHLAQLVEQGIENPRVPGSIPGVGTNDAAEDDAWAIAALVEVLAGRGHLPLDVRASRRSSPRS